MQVTRPLFMTFIIILVIIVVLFRIMPSEWWEPADEETHELIAERQIQPYHYLIILIVIYLISTLL